MAPFDEKPFRSEKEPDKDTAGIRILMGHPRVRPHVVPDPGLAGEAAGIEVGKGRYVTSFLVTWQPEPVPPAHWIELLREAPFGTQGVRARQLHWDGRLVSIELLSETEIEAFGVEMPDWVAFANAEFGRRGHAPDEEAMSEAARRADALEQRLRRIGP